MSEALGLRDRVGRGDPDSLVRVAVVPIEVCPGSWVGLVRPSRHATLQVLLGRMGQQTETARAHALMGR
jgi:hypothetical protein